jgi:hypothetical protein
MNVADLLRIRHAERKVSKMIESIEGLKFLEFTTISAFDRNALWEKLSSTSLSDNQRLNEPYNEREAAAWVADVSRTIDGGPDWLLSLGGFAQLGWARVRATVATTRWLPSLLARLDTKDAILIDERRGKAYGFSDEEDALIFARLT